MKRVVIVGSGGQDGRLLFERLAKNCAVFGLDTATTMRSTGYPPSHDPVDLRDADAVARRMQQLTPDEVYYLAARHHASEEHPDEARELRESVDVHVLGLTHFLEAIRKHVPAVHLFYAGSSQMFGQPATAPQDESTPFAPRNAYAITKVAGARACAFYRERFGVHASVGILYNHESPLRGHRFVSTRIARGARQATRNLAFKLTLGSLAATVDWGYAPDFVDAMVRIVEQPDAADYVIATGELHTVRDFVEVALLARQAPVAVVGDASKLRTKTGWKPTIDFETMVKLLVDAAD